MNLVEGSPSGSCPLTRGKPVHAARQLQHPRLIPAHAGKTSSGAHRASGGRAHPRSRGENAFLEVPGKGHFGSSPLTRENQRSAVYDGVQHGLIPAHAGKTGTSRCSSGGRGAHPRSRGENSTWSRACRLRAGSPPLTRGKQAHGHPHVLDPRLIPAHAGKTLGQGPRERLIPAHAGKTPLAARSAACAAAHPRSRGENRGNYTSHNVVAGSSPLTRGKHYVDVVPSMKGFGSSPLTRGKLRGAR